MCLGEIARVDAVRPDGTLLVHRPGRGGPREATVSPLALAAPVEVGSWVLVHAGFAINTLSPDDAAEALALRAQNGGRP
jgi:hydrogenase maturation factor